MTSLGCSGGPACPDPSSASSSALGAIDNRQTPWGLRAQTGMLLDACRAYRKLEDSSDPSLSDIARQKRERLEQDPAVQRRLRL